MALKSTQFEPEKAEQIEESLEELDKTLDRLKVLYEQYFLGIQKQPPAYLHTDVERKLRELTQLNIRNTGLRYRFNTLQQKFGSYNSYWRRTLRQIEHGTYTRNLSKVGRKAAKSGEDIPDEILAAMPKRMRDQVVRDRDAAIALAKRQKLPGVSESDFAREEGTQPDLLTLAEPADDAAAFISEPSILRREVTSSIRRDGAFVLDDKDDFDLDAFLAANTNDDAPKPAPRAVVTAAPIPSARTGPVPRVPPPSMQTGPVPAMTGPMPAIKPPAPPPPRVGPPPIPPRTGVVPVQHATGPVPAIPQARPRTPSMAPSQQSKPIPIVTGASTRTGPVQVQSVGGRGFERNEPAPRAPRDTQVGPSPAMRPPPGMSDSDVDALYNKYVAAKKMVGEDVAGAAARDKLLRTINAQAPKIMEQYKAKGVDFSVVVKDNQVIIRAKPKP